MNIKLRYASDTYLPYKLYENRAWEDKQMREEYSRLRTIAQKRIARLRKAGYNAPADFRKLKELKFGSHFAGELAAIVTFLMREDSTIKGAKAKEDKKVEFLQARGLKFITRKNVRLFDLFMQYAREESGMLFDSEKAFAIWEDNRGTSLEELKEKFDQWMDEHESELAKKVYNK